MYTIIHNRIHTHIIVVVFVVVVVVVVISIIHIYVYIYIYIYIHTYIHTCQDKKVADTYTFRVTDPGSEWRSGETNKPKTQRTTYQQQITQYASNEQIHANMYQHINIQQIEWRSGVGDVYRRPRKRQYRYRSGWTPNFAVDKGSVLLLH